ncbi:hypothetical protein M408DRAFT_29668 [Serendipita vermifera MAFF 305830]|uniref:F-box domain-containing protein n=1 Tax=Serendipita vermifera MAFF 305830 TaxID=933852 RepID=A0A0C3APW4_SERVB|nr:hypothetical protein M408DRAFT_29668 [Serendipita vermifera MAFF 305830]
MSHNLVEEIHHTTKSLQMVKEREHKAALELESIQSERQALERFVATLEDQHKTLQLDIQRFAGLLHPIRRCPSDILRMVFQQLVLVENANWCATPIKISHICRQWRAIAVDTPGLWGRIIVPKLHFMALKLPLLRTVFARLRSVAPEIEITVWEVGDYRAAVDPSLLFGANNNDLRKSIKLLEIYLPTRSMPNFIGFTVCWPKWIECLQIVATGSLEAISTFHLTRLIDNFPLIKELRLYNVPELAIEQEMALDSVQILALTGVRVIPPFASLAWLSNLVTLDVTITIFQDDMLDTDINLENLQDIRVNKSDGIPWTRLYTPQLARMDFFFGGPFPEDVLSFMKRNQQIRRFAFRSIENNLQVAALVLPELETLEIAGDYQGLYDHSTTGSQVLPFHRLRHLLITTYEPESVNDLEYLVAARCPRTPTFDTPFVSLKTITIRYPEGYTFNANPEAHSWLERYTIWCGPVPEPDYEGWHDCTLTRM